MDNNVNIRRVALSVLDKIESLGQYSNIALDTAIERSGAIGQDKALLTTLVYGVIERKITLDHQINSMASLPPSKIEGTVRNALRMGLYQLAFLDKIPDHAAINESVDLVSKRSKGFVNAILRGFIREGRKISLPPEDDGARYLSIKYSVAEEICRRFCDAFGKAKAEDILSALNEQPEITLRVNTLKTSREELLKSFEARGISAYKTEYSPYGIRLKTKISYSDIPGEGDGLWFVQDEASQLASLALSAENGENVIDACACPGGKSFSVAMCMENEGDLRAFDLHENKLSLIKKGAERLSIDIIKTEARDGRCFDEALSEWADKILLDVPCSGLGVMAKKPDIRYKDMKDAARLPEIQLSIAKNCFRYLKKGGIMVYSTCTLLPEENEENVKKLLSELVGIELIPFETGNIRSNGMLTLFPDEYGCDGFFIAKLRKI